jgi:hypothetical protein
MISDVLFEAADEIRRYLRDFAKAYPKGGDIEIEIQSILEKMDSARIKLDTPPE